MAKGKYRRWLEPDGLTLLQGWAREGLTDEEIAKKMGIARWTLFKWKNQYGDIGDALKRGKEVADYEVENALFQMATGYVDPDGKRHPPNITAAIFWLKNRRPEKWRERQIPEGPEQKESGPSPMQQLVDSLNQANEERKKREKGGEK